MVSANDQSKNFAKVKHSVIDLFKITESSDGVTTLKVYLHALKSHANRCPHCGKRCPVYDKNKEPKKWRGLDCGGIIVEMYDLHTEN